MRLTVGKHRAIAWFKMDATYSPGSHSNSRTVSCNTVDNLLHGFVDKHILGLQIVIKMDNYIKIIVVCAFIRHGRSLEMI